MAPNLFDTRSPYERMEHARHQRLVIAISRGMIICIIPIILVYILMLLSEYSPQVLLTLILCLLLIPIGLLIGELARRGNPTLAGYVFLPTTMFILGVNTLMVDGLILVIGPLYIALIVIAGMLLGARECYLSAVAAAVIWVGTYIATANQWVIPSQLPEPVGSFSMMLIMVLSFFFVAVLSRAATADLRRALDDATYDLVQANRKLEQANKLKSQFTARTSHELRTPLSAIIVFTDLALRNSYGPLTDKLRDSLERVLFSARRLRALIEDILDISKIEAGEMEIFEERFPIQNLAGVVRSELSAAAAAKKLEFAVSVSPELPAYILGDEKRLSQIVINLTHNAIKFTEKGSVSVTMAPTANSRWHIQVKDTGRGIKEENRESIFDEFRQEVRDSKESGTGLGLAITRNLVHMMGGEIRLKSEIGKGSTFDVFLPLKPAPPQSADVLAAEPVTSAPG